MTFTTRRISAFIMLVWAFLAFSPVCAQWGAPYANSWIKYDQPYARIGINQKGIHKVSFSSLPSGFPVNTPDYLQLWHRGRQVAILSIANNEIVFYGVPNDGAPDSLLYRPMSSRVNPYTSLYSDESAYFLTVGKEKGLRAETVNMAANAGVEPAVFHQQTDVTAFKNEYSLSTLSSIRADFFNSYFEKGASKTGTTVKTGILTNYNFQLTRRSAATAEKPVVKLMFHGRSNSSRNVEVYIGKDAQSLRKVADVPNSNFNASVYSFVIEPSDVDASGKGTLALKSVSTDGLDRYSLAFYTITYPQNLDMASAKSTEFNLEPTTATSTSLAISNTPTGVGFYDITDADVPRIVKGTPAAFSVSRDAGQGLKLLATVESTTVAAAKVTAMSFKQLDPKASNYIIITSENLDEGAKSYAAYRSSKGGGAYNTLIVKIHDIYNEFNYGEPSPVGIRRFMDYMLSDKNRDKYLFLLGKSITFNERMIRELPDEVPTIGFPGSDVLLVEGLAGAPVNVPAVPLGRLSALNNQNVADYLAKVIDYESNISNDISWRKNILHLNGGKTTDEITQLKNILANLVPKAEEGFVGGKVTAFVKQQPIGEAEPVNITPEVNAGVGMLTYFGHGSTTVTDLDIGFITDAARGYNNAGKYPLMYFNGCGVGNVFSGRFNTSPSSTDRIALSLDWILAPKRGTVALLANTFDTYVSSTTRYLDQLYNALFMDASTYQLSIGKIQAEVANRVISSGANTYDIANVHQALLQGDPALHMLSVSKPDYAVDPDEGILLYSETADKTIGSSASLRTAVVISNEGKYNADEKISVELKYFYQDGTSVIKAETINSIAYRDTIFVSVPNKPDLIRVEARIDPEGKLSEISKTNNIAELVVEWEVAAAQNLYPSEKVKDVVPPVLSVTFNDRVIENEEIVKPSPEISFTLTDDRLLPMDVSLLDIFVKSCGDNSCDFIKLDNADPALTFEQTSDRSMTMKYLSPLNTNGAYELLVNSRDNSGNAASAPYQIKFFISDSTAARVSVVCSPNPASQFVRFRAEGYDVASVSSVQYLIYDLRGVVRASKEVVTSKSGITDWYWHPDTASGTYIYKIVFKNGGSGEENVTGRVQVIH